MAEHREGEPCCGTCEHAALVAAGKIVYPSSPPIRVDDGVALVFKSGAELRRVPLSTGQRLVIGRGKDCDVSFPKDGTLGRRTCTVEVTPAGEVFVADLGSSCGTYVNGKKVHRSQLNERDTVMIGNGLTITFSRD